MVLAARQFSRYYVRLEGMFNEESTGDHYITTFTNSNQFRLSERLRDTSIRCKLCVCSEDEVTPSQKSFLNDLLHSRCPMQTAPAFFVASAPRAMD